MSNQFIQNRTLFVILLCSIFTFNCLSAEPESGKQITDIDKFSPKLMLIGGGLKICRSASSETCDSDKDLLSGNLSKRYHLSKERLENLKAAEVFNRQPQTLKRHLNTAFEYFYANEQTADSIAGLLTAFELALGEDGTNFFINLPNDIYFALQDFTEIRSDHQSSFSFSGSTSEILSQFILESSKRVKKNQNLKIVVATAGYRDAHSSALFYQSLLAQLISENFPEQPFAIEWLSLDLPLAEVLRLKNKGIDLCHRLPEVQVRHQVFDRHRVWPDLVETQKSYCQNPEQFGDLIRSAHGLFFTNGDTQRLLDTLEGLDKFIVSPVSNNVATENLFVAGDGAGARVLSGGIFANRPVPIITGGKTEVALIRGAFPLPPVPNGCEQEQNCPDGMITDDLTFMPSGPFNLLPLGVVDTQLSEQERIGRLALLTAKTKTRFGTGIDEETAVLVSQTGSGTEFEAIGSGGIMFMDMQNAIFKSQSGKHQLIGLSHYINHGDKAKFLPEANNLEVVFNPIKQQLNTKTMVLQLKPGEFRRQIGFNCGMTGFHRWTDKDIAWLVNPVEDTAFASGEYNGLNHCSYTNLLFGMEN